MISQNRQLALDDYLIQALARIGPIADNIAQTVDFPNPLSANIRHHDGKRFQSRVDIADQGSLHAATSIWTKTLVAQDHPSSGGNAQEVACKQPSLELV